MESDREDFEQDRREFSRADRPPLSLLIGSRIYHSEDWSLGGCLLSDYDGPLTPGALFTIRGMGTADDDLYQVDVRARVVRVESIGGRMGIRFHDLDASAYAFMNSLGG